MQPSAPATPEPEEEKPKEKPKDPLAALPPSKIVLDSLEAGYTATPLQPNSRRSAVNGLWNGADIPNSPTQEVSKPLPVCKPGVWPNEAHLIMEAILQSSVAR